MKAVFMPVFHQNIGLIPRAVSLYGMDSKHYGHADRQAEEIEDIHDRFCQLLS